MEQLCTLSHVRLRHSDVASGPWTQPRDVLNLDQLSKFLIIDISKARLLGCGIYILSFLAQRHVKIRFQTALK